MKRKRLAWCNKYKDKEIDFWRNAVFSDETYIEINLTKAMNRIRRFSLKDTINLPNIKRTLKHPLKIMIWSCFSYNGVGKIAIVPGSMNSVKYIETLEENLLPSIENMELNNPLFVDDSAPCHRSRIVNLWKSTNGINQMDWPGNSPDLNPIENLWSILKRRLRQIPNPNSKVLLENVYKIWFKEIDSSILKILVDSMPNRIENVLKAKGDATKY